MPLTVLMIVSVSDSERFARPIIATSEFQIGPSNLTPEPIRTPSHANEAARSVSQIAAVRPVGYADSWEPGRIGGCRPVFTNPFAELSASIPPTIMQAYVVVMILMVAGGTLLDVMHKKSAKY